MKLLFFLNFLFIPYLHAQESNGILLLPRISVDGDSGLGAGLDVALVNEWTLYGQSFVASDQHQSQFGLGFLHKKYNDFLYLSAFAGYSFHKHLMFYGYGNGTSRDDPTQYSLLRHLLRARAGFYVFDNTIIGVGGAYEQTEIGSGNLEETRQFGHTYPSAPHRDGTIFRPIEVFLLYDTQASDFAPTQGSLFEFSYSQNLHQHAEPEFMRYLAQAQHILPLGNLSTSFLIRHERVWGGDTPFFGQARLGGESYLRSFKPGRYTDFASILYGVEPRWIFWRPGGALERLELSAGVEAGRVYNDGTLTILYDQLHISWIGGLTAVWSSGIPMRLDVASGPEGTLSYLHLFYPF
ncbi:MAG: BamA/TamA family outer membrane protein [Bdellovibrionales bacterium]